MKFSARLQVLTCLMVYASSAHAIMVKYGTKGGPIEPPTPEPSLPPVQPYRVPAPVWEERSNDTPDPNAQWRPQLFIPQPRYTEIVYNGLASGSASPPVHLTNAQRFVNSYVPKDQQNQAQPIPSNYFTPQQVLSSQNLPGFGLRYFVPLYMNNVKQDDARHNQIETNEVTARSDTAHDLQWQLEKDASRRNIRHVQEPSRPFVYQWPTYVPSRHQ